MLFAYPTMMVRHRDMGTVTSCVSLKLNEELPSVVPSSSLSSPSVSTPVLSLKSRMSICKTRKKRENDTPSVGAYYNGKGPRVCAGTTDPFARAGGRHVEGGRRNYALADALKIKCHATRRPYINVVFDVVSTFGTVLVLYGR